MIYYLQNWELVVTHINVLDEGEYLCQASTHPPQHISTTVSIVGEENTNIFVTIQVHSPSPKSKVERTWSDSILLCHHNHHHHHKLFSATRHTIELKFSQ